MCFNATASISVFTLGMVCIGILLSRKLFFISLFYFTIVIMQLIEYFAHISLTSNDTKLNKLSASLVFIVLVLQPVIFTLYTGFIEHNNNTFLYITLPIIALFVALSTKLYKTAQSTNTMRVSYINNSCSSNVCRLEWSFLKSNYILSSICIFLYFLLFTISSNYFKCSKICVGDSFRLVNILLASSLVYMTFIDKLPFDKHLVESFGSIWCILATLVGPYFVFSTSN